jgi:2-keto-4-pentenoate hydratase/2-oxohepta-3-ene-1,7-dioic acid hydratase in catechol pathway
MATKDEIQSVGQLEMGKVNNVIMQHGNTNKMIFQYILYHLVSFTIYDLRAR